MSCGAFLWRACNSKKHLIQKEFCDCHNSRLCTQCIPLRPSTSARWVPAVQGPATCGTRRPSSAPGSPAQFAKGFQKAATPAAVCNGHELTGTYTRRRKQALARLARCRCCCSCCCTTRRKTRTGATTTTRLTGAYCFRSSHARAMEVKVFPRPVPRASSIVVPTRALVNADHSGQRDLARATLVDANPTLGLPT